MSLKEYLEAYPEHTQIINNMPKDCVELVCRYLALKDPRDLITLNCRLSWEATPPCPEDHEYQGSYSDYV